MKRRFSFPQRWRGRAFPRDCHVEERGRSPSALVRLRRRGDREVRVRSYSVKNRGVSNRDRVAEMRGGEQRNENDQSLTQAARRGRRCELDSVGVDRRAFERKAKPVRAGARALRS